MPGVVSESIKNEINEIMNRYPHLTSLRNLYVLEKIPAEMLKNAIASYIDQLANDEAVLILYDGTTFGSAKNGFVITTKCIYWKTVINNEIGHVQIDKTLDLKSKIQWFWENSVFTTDNGQVGFTYGYEDLIILINAIITFLKNHDPNARTNTDASTTTGQEAISGICKGCGAPKTGSDPCEYCGTV